MIARLLSFAVILAALGCHAPPTTPPTTQTSSLQLVSASYDSDIDAVVTPPVGWKPDPLKLTANSKHRVWISESGRTAYGVICFTLPFPIGHDLALWGFMKEMRRTEGEAKLVSKEWDEQRHELQFVARGGRYVVRTNLIVRGFHGWACYAGTLRNDEIVPDELRLAEAARDRTSFGSPAK